MSDARRIDRRALFDLFRRSAAAPAAAVTENPISRSPFSLEDFYEERARAGEKADSLPPFALREGLPRVETVPAYAEPVAPPGTKRET